MNIFQKLITKLFGSESDAAPANARDWLKVASERDFIWRDMDKLDLPSRAIFVSDPTNGSDYHMKDIAEVEADSLQVWVLESGPAREGFDAHTNTLVWLEASGTVPVSRGSELNFGVDAACFGLGDLAAAHAFTRLTGYELDAGRGDSFEWIGPYIRETQHFARWLEIPPSGHPMFVASTGNDGGFAAVWLYAADDELSGILIDIGGRASDQRYLDKLLPDRV